jgi:hypothetical protein
LQAAKPALQSDVQQSLQSPFSVPVRPCTHDPDMRATIIASADRLDELAAADAWFARWGRELTYRSEDRGCGCCIEMWDVEGPDEAIEALPSQLRAMSEWTDPPRPILKQLLPEAPVRTVKHEGHPAPLQDLSRGRSA